MGATRAKGRDGWGGAAGIGSEDLLAGSPVHVVDSSERFAMLFTTLAPHAVALWPMN